MNFLRNALSLNVENNASVAFWRFPQEKFGIGEGIVCPKDSDLIRRSTFPVLRKKRAISKQERMERCASSSSSFPRCSANIVRKDYSTVKNAFPLFIKLSAESSERQIREIRVRAKVHILYKLYPTLRKAERIDQMASFHSCFIERICLYLATEILCYFVMF